VGFTLFLIVPAPYVDASASAAFPARPQRLVVAAAGIMVELLLAATALAVWINVQPGIVRDFAFVTMFIASVSTLMFNGNPLLTFDAYYVMCDALDLPNLASRSKTWWTSAILRCLGGQHAAPTLQVARGEGKWLLFFAPLSFAYRIVVAAVIVRWIGTYSSIVSAIAASFLVVFLLIKPVWRFYIQMRMTFPAGATRWRASVVGVLVAIGTVSALWVVPVPFYTVARGVVWPLDHARVRPLTEGFVAQFMVRDGAPVAPGQVLVVLDDPVLYAERRRLASRLEQLQAGRFATLLESTERARNAEEEIARIHGDLRRIEERIAHLSVRAQVGGTLVMPRQADLTGSFTRQGNTLGFVFEHAPTVVRVAVPENDAVLMRESTRGIEVRMAGVRHAVPAELMRDIPAATHDLPSAALGNGGGGPHATDPADETGLRTQEPVVLVDLKLSTQTVQRIGGRAWVRFDHGLEPLAKRWQRELRQVFFLLPSPSRQAGCPT
jgi:putative peptide zinc metalloprotease protein